MGKPIELKAGDACPACGGELKAAAVPTDEQFARAFDKENPQALQPGADTASAAVRAELGALHRCVTCGYQARFKGTARTKGQKAPTDEQPAA
jgi:Zn ribbon nucleic-acid-binding protein